MPNSSCTRYTTFCMFQWYVCRSINNLKPKLIHYIDVIMGAMAFHMTSLTIVYSTVYSCADHRAPKLRVSGLCVDIHQWPMNSPHKWPVTRKIIPCDDVILLQCFFLNDKCAVTLLISMFGNHFSLLHGIFLWSYDGPRGPFTKQYLIKIRKSNRIRCLISDVNCFIHALIPPRC